MAKKYLDYDGLLYFWQKIKSAFITDVTYNSSRSYIQKTKNGMTSDVVAIPVASDNNPKMNGTASAGTYSAYSRHDHIHPTDTSRAPLASPAFTGTPTAPTAATTTNSTQIATTAFVKNVVGSMTSGVSDVTVAGTSVVTSGVANIPYANEDGYGVVKLEDDGSELAITWTDRDSTELTYNVPYLDQNGKVSEDNLPTPTRTRFGVLKAFVAETSDGKRHSIRFSFNGTDFYDAPRLINDLIESAYLPDASSSAKGAVKISSGSPSEVTVTTGSTSYSVPTLDANGLIPSNRLPSYVDDVIEAYARSNQTELGSTWLATGSASGTVITPETGKIYVLMNDSTSYAANSQFRWGGTAYVKLSDGGVSEITNAEIDTILAS